MSTYTPPNGDEVNFDLKLFTPPQGDEVDFELDIIPEVSHLYIYKNGSWQKIFPKTYHNGEFKLRITRVYYLDEWKEVISFPHPVWEVTGLDAPEKVAKDTNFTISVLVKNIGNASGDKTINFYLGNDLIDSVTKSLIPNQQETFSIETSIDTVGNYTINVEELSTAIEIGVASFSYSNLRIEPEEPEENEEFTIKIDVENTTDFTGEYTVAFEVDEEEIGSDTKTVEANDTETFSTTHSIEEVGTYDIEAGTESIEIEIFGAPEVDRYIVENGETLDDWTVFTDTSTEATYSITEESDYIYIVYMEGPDYGASVRLDYNEVPFELDLSWDNLVVEYNVNAASDGMNVFHQTVAEFKVGDSTIEVEGQLTDASSGIQKLTLEIPEGATELIKLEIGSMAFFYMAEVQIKVFNVYFEEDQ